MLYNLNMDNLIYIDSSKARGNFSDILNSVFTDKKTYVIKKSGIPVAKIISLEENNIEKDEFMNFAGMLSEKKGDKILKMIKTGRNDGSRLKSKLL